MYKDIKKTCHKHGGFLPEPRDQGENQFLTNLTTGIFALGITDKEVEGQWLRDSDRSPVTWFGWVNRTDTRKEPNGGVREDCVVMLRQVETASGPVDGWGDYDCGSHIVIKGKPQSLICQRKSGMCTQLIIIK